MNPPPASPTVCIAEDRQSCEPALRILVASLTRHCPGVTARLFCPNASEAFVHWLADYPAVRLDILPPAARWSKYDIKPAALLAVLAAGAEGVVWIDSDIVVTRDFRPLLAGASDATIAVTEEAMCSGHSDPDGLRARLWGFPVERALPFTVNTGVVRVTRVHIPLLQKWNDLLESDAYRAAQERPWAERGLHMMGDQEVLTALLATAPFHRLPILFLRRGRDIIQFFGSSGYTLRERLLHLRRGLPPFIHSQGFRPWWPRDDVPHGLSARFAALYRDLSPYTLAASDYADVLEDAGWLRSPSATVGAMRMMGWKKAPLVGLPLAVAADAARTAKRLTGHWRSAKRALP